MQRPAEEQGRISRVQEKSAAEEEGEPAEHAEPEAAEHAEPEEHTNSCRGRGQASNL